MVITLDAGPAFGSGTHESTRGCLLALDALAAERGFATALDLGCGSGVLAIAIAQAFRIPVTACDNDPAAVANAHANARANGAANLITVVEGDGPAAPALRARAPFDLIVANILAEPLIEMAAEMAAVLGPRGVLILSGLLTTQEGEVAAAYEGLGLVRRRVVALGEWSTMILARGGEAA